jgi:hypothetical protein
MSDGPLPAPWAAFQDGNGRTYYVNTETKTSQWERPDFPGVSHQAQVSPLGASTGPSRPASSLPTPPKKLNDSASASHASLSNSFHAGGGVTATPTFATSSASSTNPHRVGVDNGLVAQTGNTASFGIHNNSNNSDNAYNSNYGRNMASPVQVAPLVDLQAVLCQPLLVPIVCMLMLCFTRTFNIILLPFFSFFVMFSK